MKATKTELESAVVAVFLLMMKILKDNLDESKGLLKVQRLILC
jgi:hypothetical protein